MAEYIDRDEVLEYRETVTTDDYSGNETLDVVAVEEILEVEPVDVVEREKIEQAIAEIKDGYYGNEEKSETDSERADAFNNGLNYALEILKRNIGE